jgi:Rad3-related DNA helicase
MKWMLPLMIVLLAGNAVRLRADSLSEAAALAAQRDAEERYKRLSADVQELLDTQAVLLKRLEESRQRIDRLSDEVRSLKEEHNRTSGNAVSRDEFRKYVEKLKELDEKREADKKLILDNIKSLANLPPPAASDERDKDKGNARRKNNHSAERNTERPADRSTDVSEEPPYLYTVKKNDQLLTIVASYNEYFQEQGLPKITVEQVLKANPGLKADHLVAGRKIRIPALAKDK